MRLEREPDYWELPKSHQTRQVSIDLTTCQIRRNHHDYQLSIALRGGCVSVRPDRLTQALKRITDRVPGAAEIRLHDLRHCYATTQLDADESLTAVAARIGDHVETLANVYAHRGYRSDRAAADDLGARLDGAT